jgi:SAM-dependent methyltransferase
MGSSPPACSQCGVCPTLRDIPWLAPRTQLSDWQDRYRLLLQTIAQDLEEIKAAARPTKTTEARLARLARALEGQRRALEDVLAPLRLGNAGSESLSLALKFRLPTHQTLSGYEANLFRDWAWNNGENEASLAVLEAALGKSPKLGRVLVLGAGACRLAYDLHRSFSPVSTVATDVNPLLLLVAREVLKGEKVKLWEFPVSPLTENDVAVERELKAPAAADDKFSLAFADALHLPFAEGSFDTVVTPWLVDILAAGPRALLSRVNRLLAPGGKWIHFGPFGFATRGISGRLSPKEVAEIAADCGLQVKAQHSQQVPYLQSPSSHHGRVERVHAWVADKTAEAEAPKPETSVPEWLSKGTLPVPHSRELWQTGNASAVQATLIGLVDGKRSLADMAKWMEQTHGIPQAQGLESLRTFFMRLHEESLWRLY